MKLLFTTIAAITVVGLFTQCKKNNTPQQQGGGPISDGYYVIRTKYMCADGKAFVLGSFSNHEIVDWYKTSPEDLKAIIKDGPHESIYGQCVEI